MLNDAGTIVVEFKSAMEDPSIVIDSKIREVEPIWTSAEKATDAFD